MAMPVVTSPLVVALRRLGPPGVAVGHRIICEGDEEALLPNERLSIGPSAVKVRRQSGAARVAARQLLSAFGLPDAALPRSASGAPVWPSGYVGSLAHDADIALAAAASIERFLALGIDVEPAVDLPPNLVDVVTTPAEFAHYPVRIIRSRLLFAIKEAVYKATNPLDGVFLDFHDITVDLDAGQACIRGARKINFTACTAPRIVALAYIEAIQANRDRGPHTCSK